MQKIRVTIGRDGTQKIEVLEGRGDDCLELTRELERRLGTPVGERVRKSEAEAERVEESQRESEA